jgi:peroxiredoxin
VAVRHLVIRAGRHPSGDGAGWPAMVADLGWSAMRKPGRPGRPVPRRKGSRMAVEVGQEAPDFELSDQHGKPVRLSSFRGAKNVVLLFYPLAFSGVCSGEMAALRDDFPEADRDDVELLTVSVDSSYAHRVWADREGFGFELLSDFWPHGEVAKRYGVFNEDRGISVRGTFIIDKDGIVRWKVVNPTPQARDIADYQKALAALS